ncbi:MAG: hypothetical protein DA408_16385 [Bacteroidetes bacterium]|nr:MAG: hypothetical protein C7N36_17100 [Bacteroidota bacterium]PTM10298.1 MAG: hypothetical protein DA408_16385 [Bacteroidota bacterium]
MTNQQFFAHLGIVTAATAAILLGLQQIPAMQSYQIFGWICLGGFVVLSILMFLVARVSAKSKNKNDFTSTVLGFTAGKMMFTIMILYTYLKLAEPADKFFVAPFFTCYFIYTAFETYFMMRLGRTGV